MARDINDKVRRRNLSNRVIKGEEIKEFNETKSQLMEIMSEQRRNLDEQMMLSSSFEQQDQILQQAAQLGGTTSSPANFNPATMELLRQYGVGQPQSVTKSTQVTPQNIVVNNTTNNVQVAEGRGGSGATEGENSAKFKTWITNLTVSQSEQAIKREKEFQKRDWELTRSTNKLMNRLDEIGTNFEERTDPEKTSNILITGLKSVLLLLGFGFLMKNIKSVGSFLSDLTGYFGVGGSQGYSMDNFLDSKFVTSIRSIFTGSKGGKSSNGGFVEDIVSGISNAISNLAGPITKSIGDALRKFADDRAEAFKSITFPSLDMSDLNGSFGKIVQYLGTIIKVGFGGTKSLANAQANDVTSTAVREITSSTGLADGTKNENKSWENSPTAANGFLSNGSASRNSMAADAADKLGITNHKYGEVAIGDAGALVKDDSGKYYDNRIRKEDIKGDALVGITGQVRGNAAIESMLLDKSNKVFASQAYAALGMLKETAKKDGEVLISPEALKALGVSTSHVPNQGETYITAQAQDRTDKQILQDFYVNADSAQRAGIDAAIKQFGINFLGDTAKNIAGGFLGGIAQKGLNILFGEEGDNAIDAFISKNKDIKDIIEKERAKGVNKRYGLVTSTDKSGKKFLKLNLSDFEGLENILAYNLKEHLPGQLDSQGNYSYDSFNFDNKDGGISLKAFTDKRVQLKEEEAIKAADKKLNFFDGALSPESKEKNKKLRRQQEIEKISTDYDVNMLEESILKYNKPKLNKNEYTFGNAPKSGWGPYSQFNGKNPIPKSETRRRAAALIRYFVEVHGLEGFQAAGIVGNLWRESGLFEGAVNEGYSSRATGLAQWLGEDGPGSGNNRKGYLLSAFGDNPSFEEQVRYIEHEFGLRQIEKLGEGGGWKSREGAWNDIKNSTSDQEAHDIFLTRFEFGPKRQSVENVMRELDTYNKVGDGKKTVDNGRARASEAAALDIYGQEFATNPADYLNIDERYSISKNQVSANKDKILNESKLLKGAEQIALSDSILTQPITPFSSQIIPPDYSNVLKDKSRIEAKLDSTGEDIALNTATSAELLGELTMGVNLLCTLTAAQKNIPQSPPTFSYPKSPTARNTTSSDNTAKITK